MSDFVFMKEKTEQRMKDPAPTAAFVFRPLNIQLILKDELSDFLDFFPARIVQLLDF